MCICVEDYCNKDWDTAVASVRRYYDPKTTTLTTTSTQPPSPTTTLTEIHTTTERQSTTITSATQIITTTERQSNTTKDLDDLDQKKVTEASANKVASRLQTIVANKTDLTSEDIDLTGKIVHKFSNLSSVGQDTVKKIASSVSSVMGQDQDVIQKARNGSEMILATLDALTDTIALPPNASFLLHKETNLDLYYSQCSCQNFSRPNVGYTVKYETLTLNDKASAADLNDEETTGFFMLRLPECRQDANEASIRFQLRLLKSSVLYGSPEVKDSQCNNYVTPQSTVLTGKVARGTQGNPVVQYGLKHEYTHLLHRQWFCAYWINGSLWTTNNIIQTGSSGFYTECHANHLTDFSLLVNIQEKDPCVCDKTLSVLSTVALSVSVISGALLLAFVIYSNFIGAREMRRRLGRTAAAFTGDKPVQLCVLVSTLLIFMMLFLLFADKEQFKLSHSSCHATAALLYWLCLSSFCHASLRGLYFHRKFVSVLPSQSWFGYPYFNTIGSAVAIGVPGLITGVIYGSRPSLFQRGDSFCWIRPELVTYGLIVPSTIMLLLNLAVFVRIVRSVYYSVFKEHENRPAFAIQKKKISLLLACTLLMVVLEFPWVMQYFTLITVSTNCFHYLFVVTNGLQGLWLFSLHMFPVIAQLVKKPATNCRSTAFNGVAEGRNARKPITHLPLNECNCNGIGARGGAVRARALSSSGDVIHM